MEITPLVYDVLYIFDFCWTSACSHFVKKRPQIFNRGKKSSVSAKCSQVQTRACYHTFPLNEHLLDCSTGVSVIWRSANASSPAVISAPVRINGWKTSSDIQGAFEAPAPSNFTKQTPMRQLWVNGIRAERSRLYPGTSVNNNISLPAPNITYNGTSYPGILPFFVCDGLYGWGHCAMRINCKMPSVANEFAQQRTFCSCKWGISLSFDTTLRYCW